MSAKKTNTAKAESNGKATAAGRTSPTFDPETFEMLWRHQYKQEEARENREKLGNWLARVMREVLTVENEIKGGEFDGAYPEDQLERLANALGEVRSRLGDAFPKTRPPELARVFRFPD